MKFNSSVKLNNRTENVTVLSDVVGLFAYFNC
jgi:hypothetical protein